MILGFEVSRSCRQLTHRFSAEFGHATSQTMPCCRLLLCDHLKISSAMTDIDSLGILGIHLYFFC